MGSLHVMHNHIHFLYLQITRSDIGPHVKCAVNMVTADGHNLPQGFVWVCMGSHTHFITPEDTFTASTLIIQSLHYCKIFWHYVTLLSNKSHPISLLDSIMWIPNSSYDTSTEKVLSFSLWLSDPRTAVNQRVWWPWLFNLNSNINPDLWPIQGLGHWSRLFGHWFCAQ